VPLDTLAAIAAVVLAYFGTAFGPKPGWGWGGILWAAVVACALIPGFARDRERIALVKRSLALIPELERWLKDGETLEYRIRDDAEASWEKYLEEIEIWRNQVVKFLDRELPQSGASIRFWVADGDYGIGPLGWEIVRLRRQRANLSALLDQLEVYLRRSHLQK
jgi:MFS family permease